MRIAYYNDAGAARLGGVPMRRALRQRFGADSVSKVLATDITDGRCLRGGFDLLVMPGGSGARFYDAKLAGAGYAEIRRFVENGGCYFGTCAGAYWVSRRTKFLSQTDSNGFGWGSKGMDKANELVFFKGVAFGPYSFLPQQRLVKMDGALYGCYHHMGPSLHSDDVNDPHVRVLMRYFDIKGQPPATVACDVGKGLAVLTGLHPEYPTPLNLACGDVSYQVGGRWPLFLRMMAEVERHVLRQREVAQRSSIWLPEKEREGVTR